MNAISSSHVGGLARAAALRKARATHNTQHALSEIEAMQLKRFNSVWAYCIAERAFYRHWRTIHKLPREVAQVEQLQDFPALTKADLHEYRDLVFAESSETRVYSTGGSTSEPTKFPRGQSEAALRFASNYVGRAWWGISPRERRVLVWGHSHLYGTGLRGYVRRHEQGVKDRLMRTLRLNGYATEARFYSEYVANIIDYRPTHLVGYSSALSRLAHAVDSDARAALARLGLKGVIATADTLLPLDEDLIRRSFSCPIIIEYGAAEAGVIAMSRDSTRNIQVLWDQHLLAANDAGDVFLSSLQPRQFPLIQYELGDKVVPSTRTAGGSLIALTEILGRSNDVLSVATDGGMGTVDVWLVHLTHIIKAYGSVRAVQFGQRAQGKIVVFVEGDYGLNREGLQKYVAETLKAEMPRISTRSLTWDFDSPHQQSASGKHLNLRRP